MLSCLRGSASSAQPLLGERAKRRGDVQRASTRYGLCFGLLAVGFAAAGCDSGSGRGPGDGGGTGGADGGGTDTQAGTGGATAGTGGATAGTGGAGGSAAPRPLSWTGVYD